MPDPCRDFATLASPRTDLGTAFRTEMDALYDYMMTVAFVQSVASPTAETAAFVSRMNTILAEVNTAYNQRMAQAKAATEKDKENAGKDA